MPDWLALVLGVAFLLIGGTQVVIGLIEWRSDEELLRKGNSTVGSIVDAVTFPDDDGLSSGMYRYIARFVVDGEEHRVASRFVGFSPEEYMNREVVIVFDPHHPENARFQEDRSKVRTVIGYGALFLVGTGLVVYCLMSG